LKQEGIASLGAGDPKPPSGGDFSPGVDDKYGQRDESSKAPKTITAKKML